MKVRFLLNEELITGVKRGKITAKDLVKHLLSFDNVTTLISDIDNTSISDLYVDGCKVVAGAIDNHTNEIELELNEECTIVENATTPEDVKKVKHLKSYKFSRKEILLLHLLIDEATNDFITVKEAFEEVESCCKIKNKVNIFKMVIDNFTDKNNYHSGSRINFKGGTKVYYNINNPKEAYNKALNDDFINHKDTIQVKPFYPSDFYIANELIKDYLILINQKVA